MHLLRSALLLAAVLLVPAGTAAAAPPGNDHRVNAAPLTNLIAGTNSEATKEGQGDGNRPGTGTHSVWYSYTSATTGRVTITVAAGGFNSVVGAYPDWYSPSSVPMYADADTGAGTSSAITFDTKAGQTWAIAVDGYDPTQHGTFTINPAFDSTPAAPANDAFADALTITPGTLELSQRYATAQGGEPQHRITGTPAKSLWFKWTPLVSGYARAGGFCGSADLFSTKAAIAVYTGAALGSLSEVAYSQTPGAGECTAATVHFPVVANTTYRIALDNASADTGQAVLTLAFDSTKPTTTFTTGKSVLGPQDAVTWQADEVATTFQCKMDGGGVHACSSPRAIGGLAHGAHTLEVRATDELGNVESSWKASSFTVDRVAPQTTIESGPTGAIASAKGATFTFSSSEPGSTYVCSYVKFAALKPCSSPYVIPDGLANGPAELRVAAVDAHGNQDATPATRAFTVDSTLAFTPTPPSPPSTYVPPARIAPPAPRPPAGATTPAPSVAGPLTVRMGAKRISRRTLKRTGLKVRITCACRAKLILTTASGLVLARADARPDGSATLKSRRARRGKAKLIVKGSNGRLTTIDLRIT